MIGLMKPLVSVIVPIYKVEDCLVRCLDSLCRQSMQEIEFILVNDASPDRCGAICEAYAMKDARFRVIHHVVNKGLSAARNTGIISATGDYLMFVDGDDYVHDDFCKLPYECALQFKADLILFRYQRVKNNGVFAQDSINICEPEIADLLKRGYKTRREALELMLNYNLGVRNVAWNKMYHKNVFSDIFYPIGCFYEDTATTYKTVLKAERIYYLDKKLYYHCYREGSITTLKTKKALQDWFAASLQQYYDIMDWGGYSNEKLNLLLQQIAMIFCIKKKRNLSDPDYVFCTNLLSSCKVVPKDFTMRKKLLFVLLKYCPTLFELLCILWGKKHLD